MYYLIKLVIQKYLLYGSSLLYKINLYLSLSLVWPALSLCY